MLAVAFPVVPMSRQFQLTIHHYEDAPLHEWKLSTILKINDFYFRYELAHLLNLVYLKDIKCPDKRE